MDNVGNKLKQAREGKGLTLDDLQQSTKIQKRYLIAVEEENFDALPGKFYVRAFIQQYAEVVGLDPKEVLSELDEELGQKQEVQSEDLEATTRTKKREQTEEQSGNDIMTKVMNYLPTIIIVIIVAAILGTVYVVAWGNHRRASDTQIDSSSTTVSVSSDKMSSHKVSSSKTEKSSSVSIKESKKESKKTTSSAKQSIKFVSSTGTQYTYNLKGTNNKANKIKFTISDSSAWSSVSASGSQVWQGTLTSGQSHTVTVPEGTSTITIQLGNSNSTSLKVNGKTFHYKEQDPTTTVRTLIINVAGASDSSSAGTTE